MSAISATLQKYPRIDYVLPDCLRYWAMAVLFFGVGDIVLTSIGLTMGATEGNPLPAELLVAYGMQSMIVAKLSVFLVAYTGTQFSLTQYASIFPLMLAVMEMAICAWNLFVVVTLTFG